MKGKVLMRLKLSGEKVILEDEENSFEISQNINNEIYFRTKKNNMTLLLNLSFHPENIEEWKSFELFASFIREIVGNYILEDDSKLQVLPKDFIDLENKLITCHSDGLDDSIIELLYSNDSIAISIKKSSNNEINNDNVVKIISGRCGSSYGNYYQFFVKLYRELLCLAHSIDQTQNDNSYQIIKKINN